MLVAEEAPPQRGKSGDPLLSDLSHQRKAVLQLELKVSAFLAQTQVTW